MRQTNLDQNIFKKTKCFLIDIYKNIESKVLYNDAYFLDSNFLIPKNDNRSQIFKNKKKQFLITEYVFNEIGKKSNDWQKILSAESLKIINFDDLRKQFPATCPVYYNYIKSMHNPANICSPDFFINNNFAVKEKDKFNDERKDFNQLLISRFYKGHENKTNKLGKEKTDWENYLNASFLNRIKKRKSLKNKGEVYFNDYRNLSLILIYTLLNKNNSYFFTSDIDVFCNLFTWLDSMAHQLTFKTILLNQMKEEGKKDILNRIKLVYFIKFDEFKKQCDDLLGDLSVDGWKKKRFSLTINYWDKEKQKFYNKVKFAFDDETRDLMLNNQGLLLCPFVANNTHGNFFRYLYFWPPNSIHDLNTIKVSVQAKRFIHAKNQIPPKEIHDGYCDYRKMEKQDDQKFLFQSFRVGG